MNFEQSPNAVFMVRPSAFGFNAETANSNSFQHQLVITDSAKTAQTEFDKMVTQLRNNFIDVVVFEDTPSPLKPDAVFPNNWLAIMPDGTMVLFPMLTPNRRTERNAAFTHTLLEQFNIQRTLDFSKNENNNRIVEGTGSLVFDHVYKKVYACLSARTDAGLATEIANQLGYSPVLFLATDEKKKPIYHTNVVMSICTHSIVVCLDAIQEEEHQQTLLEEFAKTNRKVIAISYHQMLSFGGNCLEVKDKNGEYVILMSETALNSLLPGQVNALSKHADILSIAIPTIEKIGGGSVRCMVGGIHVKRK
ncbi:MAG: arginine deiminase-related protein [Cyclobacteriaceae bacterium]|nr:arginine deiminase-related protein [Cyclobacteriaceae bacterium]